MESLTRKASDRELDRLAEDSPPLTPQCLVLDEDEDNGAAAVPAGHRLLTERELKLLELFESFDVDVGGSVSAFELQNGLYAAKLCGSAEVRNDLCCEFLKSSLLLIL